MLAAALALTGISVLVWRREGNLAWDDAGYLMRGLRIATRARAAGTFGAIGSALVQILRERPKPPLLIGWTELGACLLGPGATRAWIVLSSVGPFAILVGSVVLVARRLAGAWAGLVALGCLLASPLALSYGARVMVESFMGAWVLIALYGASSLLHDPRPRHAIRLGLAVGLAALTKLTVLLLLPVPLAIAAVLFARRHPLDRHAARLGMAAALAALVVAGPWYLANGRAAVRFAVFSSRYNLEAEGKTEVVPSATRLARLGQDVAGVPMLAVLGLSLTGALPRRSSADARRGTRAGDFAVLAVACAVSGAVILLVPPYFDPRFLLPAWPALAVVVGIGMARPRPGVRPVKPVIAAMLITLGLGRSVMALQREPRNVTYWSAAGLIDDLVERHGARIIANLGNTPDWNVCKTGLVNELRPGADRCHVLLDLSRIAPEALDRRLGRLDAVIVLGTEPGRPDALGPFAGLNRSYDDVLRRLRDDPRFERIPVRVATEMPRLLVFVRRR
jgi:hypothetical protein